MPLASRSLGATALGVSRIGLGLAALGRPGYITLGHAGDLAGDYSVASMAQRAHHLLDHAWSAGVTYFDAARSYGRAEEFLGGWVAGRTFADVRPVVGSKWGYAYTADWQVNAASHEVKEHTPDQLRRQLPESRERLGDFLRLYQVHSATFASGVLTHQQVLTDLAHLKSDGLHIGLTLSGADQPQVLDAAAAIQVDGRRLFDTVQVTWNLLEPSCSAILTEVHAAGMGVIVKEAVANGRLTARNLDPAFAPQRARLEAIAARHRVTLDAIAIAAVLAQPWADVVLSGAVTTSQLDANLTALSVQLSEEELADLAGLAETPADYWAKRSALPWN
jgi:aryl-alcohol dehydrogenase-like predicted oxidoreductase